MTRVWWRRAAPPIVLLVVTAGLWLGGARPLLAAAIGAIAAGLVVAVAAIAVRAGSRHPRRGAPTGPTIDPFTLGEPWRRYAKAALGADQRLHRTIRTARRGPLRDRLASIAERLDHAVAEAWEIARRGDQIDDAIRRLDPTTLKARLATFEEQAASDPSPELTEAIASVRRQLETADRLRVRSNQAATRLRLTRTRLDELVVRAEEVAVGIGDTDRYESDVAALAEELEALRLALEETRDP